ncbi:MAG TPA: tetratricopeptide repeat protein [Burkholderiaceae bacterium]|nr:tetratricopeptide repeat protein [Burkholderiaceae bacterium]
MSAAPSAASPSVALDYWEALVRDDRSLPLFEAALSIAQDVYPDLDLADVLARVDALAARLKARFAPDAPMLHKLRLLNHYFFNELHFRGNVNDYYDADNSYIHKVLERRCGIPITLAAMYMEIGQQAGIPLQGIAFPGHFLVKLRTSEGSVIIDVFEGGRSLSREDLEERLEPYARAHRVSTTEALSAFLLGAPARDILARMLRNLKGVYERDDATHRLLAVMNRLVVLLPDDGETRRDRGLLYARLECPRAAIEDLEAYLATTPQAQDRDDIRARIDTLRDAASRLN